MSLLRPMRETRNAHLETYGPKRLQDARRGSDNRSSPKSKMNLTKEQIEEIAAAIRAREYTVWMTRNAAKTNNEWSEYHPNHLRRQIASCRAILKAAGCA